MLNTFSESYVFFYHLVYHCFIFINYFLIAIGIDISDCVDTLFKIIYQEILPVELVFLFL